MQMSNLDLRVQKRYRLQLRLGGGSFGDVYQALDAESETEVALKLEHVQIDPSILRQEIYVYEEIAGGTGIPRVFWYGEECEYRVMAFELLGPNLEDLFHFCRRTFSLKTILLLTDQLIHRFQYLHHKGFIHRDIKPSNILMGDGTQGNQVYITDMGLATEFRNTEDGENEARRWNIPLIGTTRFASINAHSGVEQSRRDDMEALGYVLIYFLRGSLPWQDLETNSKEESRKLIAEAKKTTSVAELCKGLPKEFSSYFEHVRSLGFKDKPKYAYLRNAFRDLFIRSGFEYDYVFDWTELKYLMTLQSSKSGGN